MYFTGYKNSKQAHLGINILETNNQIEAVIEQNTPYIGGYKGLDGKVVLENVMGFSDKFNQDEVFSMSGVSEESIYKCNAVSQVKIGSLSDKKYLIATIYDLMCSLTEPMQGFTLSLAHGNYYYLICSQGEYIMNPNYNKEAQNESK